MCQVGVFYNSAEIFYVKVIKVDTLTKGIDQFVFIPEMKIVDRYFFSNVDTGNIQLVIAATDPTASRIFLTFKSMLC